MMYQEITCQNLCSELMLRLHKLSVIATDILGRDIIFCLRLLRIRGAIT